MDVKNDIHNMRISLDMFQHERVLLQFGRYLSEEGLLKLDDIIREMEDTLMWLELEVQV